MLTIKINHRLKSQIQELQQDQVKSNQTLNSQSYLNTMLKEKVLIIIIHCYFEINKWHVYYKLFKIIGRSSRTWFKNSQPVYNSYYQFFYGNHNIGYIRITHGIFRYNRKNCVYNQENNGNQRGKQRVWRSIKWFLGSSGYVEGSNE